MSFPRHSPHLFARRRPRPADKTHVKNVDVNNWRKKVEMASAFAVSEVFSQKRRRSGIGTRAVSLQNSDQLRDHDDAYSEAHELLGDWLGSKLRLELETDDEEDFMSSAEGTGSPAPSSSQPPALSYNKFDDLYKHLAEEEEQSTMSSILQDLMKQEVLGPELMVDLVLDAGQTRRKFRAPTVTMELRHQQVREKRVQREAERRRQQREKEAQQRAREEAKRREREQEMKRRQEERRQEEMVQQEMVKLRRQREERRGLEQLARRREREREAQRGATNLQPATALLTEQQHSERLLQEQKIQAAIHMSDLKCLQKHFSGWFWLILNQRLQLGKARALCEWKMRLRAWRRWRAAVWAQRKRREVARTEEELRTENRKNQLAVESDRRRLLRRCLNEWQLWCRVEKQQRELTAQQEETRRRMAALISAATAGKLSVAEPQPVMSPAGAPSPSEVTTKEDHQRSCALTPKVSAVRDGRALPAARPSEPWQITRRHAAPTATELRQARRRGEADGPVRTEDAASTGGGLEGRQAVQQQIIRQQRKLLKEQQQQISRLREEHSVMGLKLEMERTAQLAWQAAGGGPRGAGSGGGGGGSDPPTQQRAPGFTGEPDRQRARARTAVAQRPGPHPIIRAMEARAQQRAQRRKEIEELKRKKEEQKLAEMKAAEEQRQEEEAEEKRRAAERRREEKRREREREEEKQRRRERERELLEVARRHYDTASLRRRGLAPWKRLIQLRQESMKLAESHHNLLLLRRCLLYWQQSARESVSERETCADRLYQHFLLRRGLSCWKRLKDMRLVQELRAERFHRARTLRKFLLALQSHVAQERLEERERQERAEQHDNRRLLQRCVLAWRKLPDLLRREREREARRQKLIRKVAQVLPDFCARPASSPPEEKPPNAEEKRRPENTQESQEETFGL